MPAWAFVVFACLIYLALQGHRRLFLRIESTTPQESVHRVSVWWTAKNRPFNPADSLAVELPTNAATLSVPLPVDIDTVQIRLTDLAGKTARFGSLSLATPYTTLARWDASDKFGGWHPLGTVETSIAEASGMELRVAGTDAMLQIDDIHALRDGTRRTKHALLALAGAAAIALLHLVLLTFLGPARRAVDAAPAPRISEPASPKVRTLARSVVAASIVGAILAAVMILRRHESSTGAVFSDVGEYSLTFVDHLGRRISDRDGSLHLQLDPFALFRNAPNQSTLRFKIDAHGYRGGFDAADHRPRVLIVGGSAAFGFGLENDDQVFSARLAGAAPQWQFINASVVGYLSGQEVSELVHRGRDVAPDAVIALDGWNDLYVPLLAATRFPMRALGAGFNWDIFALVEGRLRAYTVGGSPSAWQNDGREEVDRLAERISTAYLANIDTMRSWATARGSAFLVVLQPWVGSRKLPHPDEAPILQQWSSVLTERTSPDLYDRFRARARQEFDRLGISYVDLNETSPFATGNEGLFLDIVHPNAAGQARIADQILPRIELPARQK